MPAPTKIAMNRFTPSAASLTPANVATRPISVCIEQQFSPAVRARGDALFQSGGVHRFSSNKQGVASAVVRGSMNYQVDLLHDDDALVASCTCPHFEEGNFCKHIWAVVRFAEGNGVLPPVPVDRRIRLMAEGDFPSEAPEADADAGAPPPVSTSDWRRWFVQLGQQSRAAAPPDAADAAEQEILYFINVAQTRTRGLLVVDVMSRARKLDGAWGRPRPIALSVGHIGALPDAADRQVLALLSGVRECVDWAPSGEWSPIPPAVQVPMTAASVLVPLLCATGRCRLRLSDETSASPDALQGAPLRWETEPWRLHLVVQTAADPPHYLLTGELRRGELRQPVTAPRLLTAGGLVFSDTAVAPLQDDGAFYWIGLLRQVGPLRIPIADGPDLLEKILRLPHTPPLTLPESLRFETVEVIPTPVLRMRKDDGAADDGWLHAVLGFDYDGWWIEATDVQPGRFDAEKRRFIRRDLAREQAAADLLRAMGLRLVRASSADPAYRLPAKRLPALVRALMTQGWRVEAEGRLFRTMDRFSMEVRSGVDWFELHGVCDFGTATARLPELLAALKRGEQVVTLADGSLGLLPEDWLNQYGFLAALGRFEDGHVRFAGAQMSLLDALLASRPEVRFDERFRTLRAELRSFSGVAPAVEPPGFVGELRPYQREGLGWLLFLQRFGFGGCLADAMGLGKTAQTLALLEMRRARRAAEGLPPSLVVAPRSLIFNWRQEAEKFTPRMRVLEHAGVGRAKSAAALADYDLILTTYGTLRRDAPLLRDFTFDYVILDEAQAIKNARSESAKAARLLNCRHRLALSGTPVENHLGELWSLFEFLNPGMLNAASVFKLTATGGRTLDPDLQAILSRALRPFILRRTKEQVARDLPAKTEQTIYCEMGAAQRRAYNELRDHYRRTLLGLVSAKGIQSAKIQILEALLRLRQAACHPGLLDSTRADEPSAKLETFFMHLTEVLESGSKVLVFSQFTSLLALIRKRLDANGVTYEYLDGRTRNRQERVERFQSDPDCKLFLISLRAGGQGLNLTAAEYVFLLDPWWNPAVEAQAIDRAHRIGQTRPVFAYRLIVKDTVEEKVLELQATKRELADAIITADNSLIRQLERADLELLLS